METVLYNIPDCEAYLDNIGNFSNSWESPFQVLEQASKRYKLTNFILNPLKCKWAVQKTDWLGYWLTPNGFKPRQKFDTILHLQPPTNYTAVTYHRDMYPH